MKEQHTVLALSCARRESTAEASGRANTPSVITTAPENLYKNIVMSIMFNTYCHKSVHKNAL